MKSREGLSFRLAAAIGKADGNVIVEFAFVAPVLVLLILNVVDFSALIWDQMAVDYSAQMGAQAAYKTCASGTLPAMANCSNLNTQVATAIHSTPLGSAIVLAKGSPAETYYCVSGTELRSVGTYSSPPNPFNCSAVGNAGGTPGDYIEVDVTYPYTPKFSGLSLARATTLTGKSMERLK
jgi:Flp pilus assembly protein TadG